MGFEQKGQALAVARCSGRSVDANCRLGRAVVGVVVMYFVQGGRRVTMSPGERARPKSCLLSLMFAHFHAWLFKLAVFFRC